VFRKKQGCYLSKKNAAKSQGNAFLKPFLYSPVRPYLLPRDTERRCPYWRTYTVKWKEHLRMGKNLKWIGRSFIGFMPSNLLKGMKMIMKYLRHEMSTRHLPNASVASYLPVCQALRFSDTMSPYRPYKQPVKSFSDWMVVKSEKS
jgi:hypothetical protein